MTEKTLRVVSANLGCASPSPGQGGRRAHAGRLAEELHARRPDLLFIQEIPDTAWLDDWHARGYEHSGIAEPPYQAKSAVIWREDLGAQPLGIPTAAYHRSYLAGAEVDLGFGKVALLSVHASPNVVEERYLRMWDACGVSRPTARLGGGRENGRLFDADLVLETVGFVARELPVLAVGDLNECRQWDRDHGESWGELYFARASELSLDAVLHEQWGSEHPTFFGVGRTPYQLDHVLASATVAPRVRALDPPSVPDPRDVQAGAVSDHAPVWFEILVKP